MKIRSQEVVGFVLLAFIFMGAGCAATHKTTTTETTVQTQTASAQPPAEVVEKSTTTITSTETKPQQTGIIGGLFQIIGSVIAFPFIVIGGLLRMIF